LRRLGYAFRKSARRWNIAMKHLSRALLAALACVPLACKSTPDTPELPCTCGTPAADLDGCVNPICSAGKTNPNNPDCVCGQLSIPK
jgi:hypothetical protein